MPAQKYPDGCNLNSFEDDPMLIFVLETNMPKKQHKSFQDGETDQWVMLLPDSCAKQEGENATFCKLKHPKTDEGCMFLFSPDNKKVFEVLKFNEDYRSWFIGDFVQSDGSFYLTSPVDPVFLALPYLIKSAKSGKFMTLEQIIDDSEFPECHRLCSCEDFAGVQHVCEVKGADDYKVYRYDNKKTLKWLQSKVNKLASVLNEKQIQTSSSVSHVSTYVISSNTSKASSDELKRFAHGIISEYLPESLSKTLQDYLGIKEEAVHEKPEISEPKSKKAKVDLTPVEDYSKENEQKDDKPKLTRLSVAQKKLEKVDKKGMKNISSFFTPKNKK